MIGHLRTLYAFRELLWVWSLREIRIRYKQSVLGVAWAILQPTALMIVLTVVFSFFARIPSDGIPYPAFSLVALLPWTLVVSSLTFGSSSLITNINLVTKIYFPREILPLGHILAAFLDFTVASIPLLGLLLYYGLPFWQKSLWLGLLLPFQFLLTTGITLPLAALMVSYRDLRFVVPLFLQIWMFASPIVYPVSLVPEKFQTLYELNPIASLLTSYRMILLHGETPRFFPTAWFCLISTVAFILGYWFFKRAERDFADKI